MADTSTQATEGSTTNPSENGGTTQTVAAAQSGSGKTFTQEQLNSLLAKERKSTEAKFADYAEIKAKAAKLDELEDAQKSDLEKLTEELNAAKAERDQLKHAEEMRTWANEVSAETNVPASVLRGSTKEEMEEHAKAILASGLSNYAKVPDSGESNSASAVTADQIRAIKDPNARIAARIAHKELFN
jgi:hypothetical protein